MLTNNVVDLRLRVGLDVIRGKRKILENSYGIVEVATTTRSSRKKNEADRRASLSREDRETFDISEFVDLFDDSVRHLSEVRSNLLWNLFILIQGLHRSTLSTAHKPRSRTGDKKVTHPLQLFHRLIG